MLDACRRRLLAAITMGIEQAQELSSAAEGWQELQAGSGASGYAPLPHSDAAVQIFRAGLSRLPDDARLRHHLAIALHARAWDLEIAGAPAAPAAWHEALAAWRAVHACPAFWAALRARAAHCDPHLDGSVVDQIRADLYPNLIAIHLDFVRHYCERGDWRRAESHVKVVEDAEFPPAIRRLLPARLHQAMTASVPGLRDSQDYSGAVDVIERYLRLFPDYTPALAQIVEVYGDWARLTSVASDWTAITRLAGHARRYAEQLDQQLHRRPNALAQLALGHLALEIARRFNRRRREKEDEDSEDAAARADLAWVIDQAVWWAQLARRHDPTSDDAQLYLAASLTARARLDLNRWLARDSDERLPVELDRAVSDYQQALLVDPQHYLAAWEGAQIEGYLEHEDLAHQLGDRAIASAPDDEERENVVCLVERLKRKVRIRILLRQATEKLEAGNAKEGVRVATEALEVNPDSTDALIVRAKCYIALGDTDKGLEDVARAEQLEG
jgi:hypothetical protein